MSEEHSASGAPIFRHEEAAPFEIAGGEAGLIAAVESHVTEHFGEIDSVWREIISPYVHVDIHVVMPTKERPGITLVTSGMSQRPMADGRYAELMLVLPPSWPTEGDPRFETDEGHWPYRLLQDLARLPHEYDTVLWSGHTVPNGDPPQPYGPGTALCGALIAPMLLAPAAAKTFVHDGHDVTLLSAWPLHADEMRFKLDKGMDAFADLLDAAKITEALDPGRPSVVPKRRRGLFRR